MDTVKASCMPPQSPISHSAKPDVASDLRTRKFCFDDDQLRRNYWNSNRNTDNIASRPFPFLGKGNRLDIREDGKRSSGPSTPISQYSDNASFSSTSYTTKSPSQKSIFSPKEGKDVQVQFEDSLRNYYKHDKHFIDMMEFLLERKNSNVAKESFSRKAAGTIWVEVVSPFLENGSLPKITIVRWREKCVFAHHPTEFHPMACDEDEVCRNRCCEYLHSDESKEKDALFVRVQLRQMYNIIRGRKKSKCHIRSTKSANILRRSTCTIANCQLLSLRRRFQDSPRSVRVNKPTTVKRIAFKARGKKHITFVPEDTGFRNVMHGHKIFEGHRNHTKRSNRPGRRPAQKFYKNISKSECQYRSYVQSGPFSFSPSLRQYKWANRCSVVALVVSPVEFVNFTIKKKSLVSHLAPAASTRNGDRNATSNHPSMFRVVQTEKKGKAAVAGSIPLAFTAIQSSKKRYCASCSQRIPVWFCCDHCAEFGGMEMGTKGNGSSRFTHSLICPALKKLRSSKRKIDPHLNSLIRLALEFLRRAFHLLTPPQNVDDGQDQEIQFRPPKRKRIAPSRNVPKSEPQEAVAGDSSHSDKDGGGGREGVEGGGDSKTFLGEATIGDDEIDSKIQIIGIFSLDKFSI
eukprot:jgi/Bigna1/80975/fgenesh1_pg.76_\